jgi:hypothetical protein
MKHTKVVTQSNLRKPGPAASAEELLEYICKSLNEVMPSDLDQLRAIVIVWAHFGKARRAAEDAYHRFMTVQGLTDKDISLLRRYADAIKPLTPQEREYQQIVQSTHVTPLVRAK